MDSASRPPQDSATTRIDTIEYLYLTSQKCISEFIEYFSNREWVDSDMVRVIKFGVSIDKRDCSCVVDLFTLEFICKCGDKKVVDCSLHEYQNVVFRYVLNRTTIREINYTQCWGDKNSSLCLVPVYIYNKPTVIAIRRHNGYIEKVELVPFFQIEGTLYVVGKYASMLGRVDYLEYKHVSISKLSDLRYVLAALPYILPHFSRRKVPVIIGPMRSGKTTTALELLSYWPEPKMALNASSFASIRNALQVSHVLNDDYGESPNVVTDWSIVIGYHDRTGVARVLPNSLKTRYFCPRGTLLVTTNNFTPKTSNILDRVRLIPVDLIKSNERYDLEELVSWVLIPHVPISEDLSTSVAGAEDVFVHVPTVARDTDLAVDPWSHVYNTLLKMLYHYRATGSTRNIKVIDGEEHLCKRLETFNNPLAPEGTLSVSRSRDLATNAITVTNTTSVPKMSYSPAFMRQILEKTYYFKLVKDVFNHYMVCVKLEDIDRAVTILEGLVQKTYKGTATVV